MIGERAPSAPSVGIGAPARPPHPTPSHADTQARTALTRTSPPAPVDALHHRGHSASLTGLREESVYPPVPTSHYVVGPLVADPSPPRASAWEVLQVDAVGRAAYAARVRQAKALLSDFQLYQQSQHTGRLSADSGGDGTSVGRPFSSVALREAAAGGSASSTINRHDGTNPAAARSFFLQPATPSSLLHEEKATAAAVLASVPPPTPANDSGSPELIGSPSALRSVEPNTHISDGAFNTAAFEAAKHRARRLLYYNAKARTAFADHRLSLTRAVYKDLLRSSTTNTTATAAAASIGGEMDGSASQEQGQPTTPSPPVASGEQSAVVAPVTVASPAASSAPTMASQASAAAAAASAAEAERALNLLSGMRAMRRQTEDLTVALLHACGEWDCWSAADGASHLFGDLFLPDPADRGGGALEDGESAGMRSVMAARERRAAACATLRRKLRLSETTTVTTDEASFTAVDAAVAFLELAETPALRLVPPPPPASTQLALFAVQQRAVRHADEERRSVTRAASSPARQGKEEEGDGGGAYGDIPRRLQELRGQRQDLQHVLEALLSTVAPAESVEPAKITKETPPPASAAAASAPAPAPAPAPAAAASAAAVVSAASSPLAVTLRTSPLDHPVLATPDSKARTAAPPAPCTDTLLASPPELTVEKTRPWVDSVVASDGAEEQRVAAQATATPAAAAVVEVLDTAAASPALRETVVELPRPLASASSPTVTATRADARGTFPSFGGSRRGVPQSSKAKAMAAAAAAAARLLSSSSTSSSASSLLEETPTSEVDEEAEVLKAAAASLALLSNRRLSASTPVRPFSAVTAVTGGEDASEQLVSAAADEDVDDSRRAWAALQEQAGSSGRECPVGAVAAVPETDSDGDNQKDEATSLYDADEGDDAYSSSGSSRHGSSSYYSTSSSSSSSGNGGVQPTSQARTASWHPHVSAALSTRAAASTAQQRADDARSGTADVLSAEVRRELLRWLSAQKQKGKTAARTDSCASPASSPSPLPSLTPEEVRTASAWLHASATLQRETGTRINSPMPAAVQHALQLLFPHHQPSSAQTAPDDLAVRQTTASVTVEAPPSSSKATAFDKRELEEGAAVHDAASGEEDVANGVPSPAAAGAVNDADREEESGAMAHDDSVSREAEADRDTAAGPHDAPTPLEVHSPSSAGQPESISSEDAVAPEDALPSSPPFPSSPPSPPAPVASFEQAVHVGDVLEHATKKTKGRRQQKAEAADARRERSFFARLFSCGG